MVALASHQLDFNLDVKPFLNNTIAQCGGLTLTEDQWLVLKGAWLCQEYSEMAQGTLFTAAHLQRTVAPDLWKYLSEVLGLEVKRRSFRRIVESLYVPHNAASAVSTLPHLRRVVGTPPSYDALIPRLQEINTLLSLIQQNRLVLLTGSAGIGKTSLLSEIFTQEKGLQTFQMLIWKYSVSNNPVEDIQDLLSLIDGATRTTIFDGIRSRRILVCLDGIDHWFDSDENRKEANQLLRRLAETEHQSCFLLTSREPILVMESLSQMGRPAKIFQLEGISEEQAIELLEPYQLFGNKLKDFILSRKGNPKNLHDSAKIVARVYGGDVDPFMTGKTSVISKILSGSFSFLFDRIQDLNAAERHILQLLASIPNSSEDTILKRADQLGYSIIQVIRAVQALKAEGLVTCSTDSPTLMIDNVVRKYVQITSEPFLDTAFDSDLLSINM
ncbi:MAG: NACHT domain-containing protein [Thermosynechococcaceae cyanobacterium MS004]|nr:NACHT domain-containing protein [Thermosynechococcaceae cyanobacterium MS004]